ncbi:MAG: hypoxanthine phosphoribosyltransferase [Planctomycetes bacterium]|nr:hypoxanthine phosphoribosyltransferase [Planctomycetota bacterium]
MRRILTEAEIETRISELAQQINADYAGKSLTVVGVMVGCIHFLSDLLRRLNVPTRVEVIFASSYRGSATSPDRLEIRTAREFDLHDQHVLLVDDIFDTGQTLQGLSDSFAGQSPASLRAAVLLWKQGREKVALQPDYHGFKIPNEFVVGYGLDFDGRYRELPYVAVLEAHEQGA